MYKPIITNVESMRRYGNSRILVFSPKLRRKIILFNNLEYYNYLFQEFDSNISFFCEKPLKISIEHDGKIKKSIFDMVTIDVYNREKFIQVTYESDLDKVQAKINFAMQSKWCELHNKEFEIFTADRVRGKEYLLTNYRTLLNLIANSRIDKDLEKKIIDIIGKRRIQLSVLFTESKIDQCEFWSTLANMIHRGSVYVNLENNPLNLGSEVENAKIF